jgi:hypothetical protein
MSKFDEKMEVFKKNNADLNLGLSESLIHGVAKSLGPSIYLADAELVSSSDKEELDRVKNNFLIKKLGLADGPELDAAIADTVDKMGSSNRNKYRVLFYALLAKKFGKESMFA